jgi:hypothetical protein
VIKFGDIFKNWQKNILLFHFFGCIFAPVNQKQQGVCHTVALPFIFKNIFFGKKKNYENSNISPCKNIIFQKSSKRNQDITTLF